ncbi:MAG: hypothetical protein WBO70_01270 [Erysipelotrichaceae bacterium]
MFKKLMFNPIIFWFLAFVVMPLCLIGLITLSVMLITVPICLLCGFE